MMTSRDRVLNHLRGLPVDRLPLMPITMMFAGDLAGIRYGDYCRDHRRLVEAQLRVAETFGFDYISAISDPAREAADCGAEIAWFDDQPPAIREECARLAEKTDLAGLKIPNPLGGGRMNDRVNGIASLKERSAGSLLIEGWVEGPCAEAADLRGINTLMMDFFDDPQFVRDLFEFVVAMELKFAQAQIEAGADLIGMGDAAASLVGPDIYDEFVLPYEKRMVDEIHKMGSLVRLHICGNTRRSFKSMGTLGADIIDLDSMAPLSEARAQMGDKQVLLGNLNPVAVLKNGTPETIRAAAAQCHKDAGSRFIIGAGCEIPRGTPKENVMALRDYAMGSFGK